MEKKTALHVVKSKLFATARRHAACSLLCFMRLFIFSILFFFKFEFIKFSHAYLIFLQHFKTTNFFSVLPKIISFILQAFLLKAALMHCHISFIKKKIKKVALFRLIMHEKKVDDVVSKFLCCHSMQPHRSFVANSDFL